MQRHRLAPLALAIALSVSHAAEAASLTPPNLLTASSLNNPDLLLVWPYAAGGPLEAMSWSTFKTQMTTGLTGSFLTPSNNLSDLGNPTIARTNLGLGSAALISTGTSGGTLCLLNAATCNFSGEVLTPASTVSLAGLNIAPGAAPTSPVNGDVWTTSSALFARINGVTRQFPTLSTSNTYSQEQTFPASTTGAASINLPPGSAPTSPNNGDFWTTSVGVFAQVNGATLAIQQGTWTPTFSFGTPGNLSVAYVTQVGYYTKVGNTCLVNAYVKLTPTYTTASGSGIIGGLPITPITTASINSAPTAVSTNSGPFTSVTGAPLYYLQGTSVEMTSTSNTSSNLTTANILSGTQTVLTFSMNYTC